jgi:hypothetical protein
MLNTSLTPPYTSSSYRSGINFEEGAQKRLEEILGNPKLVAANIKKLMEENPIPPGSTEDLNLASITPENVEELLSTLLKPNENIVANPIDKQPLKNHLDKLA